MLELTPGRYDSDLVVLHRILKSFGIKANPHLPAVTVHHSHLNRALTPYSGKHQPEMLYVGLVFKRISVTVLVVDFIVIPCEERFHIVKLGKRNIEQLNTGIFCYCLQPPLFQIGQGHGGLM